MPTSARPFLMFQGGPEAALAERRHTLMGIGNYGFSRLYA